MTRILVRHTVLLRQKVGTLFRPRTTDHLLDHAVHLEGLVEVGTINVILELGQMIDLEMKGGRAMGDHDRGVR